MKNHIVEELPARKHAPAAAGASPTNKGDKKDDSTMSPKERVSQASSDIRYKANLKDIPLLQQYNEYMQNSSMSTQERNMVKAKLFGKEGGGMKAEDFNPIFKDAASDSLAKALFKVFVEGTEQEPEPIFLTYAEELDSAEHRKYKVRVTDKNTKKSYVRYATREKINQLRANPNIESVEMTQYGEPYEGEKKKGSQTAKVAAGKGLDPVGQEDGDVDNDGDKDKSDKYLMKRRGAIGNAIATRKEEFIHEAETKDSNPEKIEYKKGKVNNKVTVAPEQGKGLGIMAHNELEGELIAENGYSKFLKKVHSLQEKAVSQNQQQLAGMALAYLRGEMPDASEEVKKMAKMGEKKLRDFAKTKHKGLPEKVKEEMECGSDDKKKKNGEEEDPRSMKTKVNLVKNKLRAMGLKMSYEPGGEVIDELNRYEKETGKDYKTGKSVTKGGTMGGDDSNSKVMRHMHKVMGAGRMGAGGPIQQRGKKKEPGKKPPESGEYGSERRSPEQIVKNRRAAKQQGRDNMSSRFD
jgi:hypothetical protein